MIAYSVCRLHGRFHFYFEERARSRLLRSHAFSRWNFFYFCGWFPPSCSILMPWVGKKASLTEASKKNKARIISTVFNQWLPGVSDQAKDLRRW